MPTTTANRPLLILRTVPALAPFEDPVGVLELLVGAEVPLADDADFVALVDELEPDSLVEVWLVVEVSELVVVVLVSVEEEVEKEEVELDVVVAKADSTELEPSTVTLSL